LSKESRHTQAAAFIVKHSLFAERMVRRYVPPRMRVSNSDVG